MISMPYKAPDLMRYETITTSSTDDLEVGEKPKTLQKIKKPRFWEQKAQSLKVMDSRKEIMGESSQQYPETSDWWYWGYFVFYGLVKLPMTETAFFVRSAGCSVVGVGPLQKLLRLPWILLWVVVLVTVYLVLLVCGSFMACCRLVRDALVFGWYGKLPTKSGMRTNGQQEKVMAVVPWWRRPLDFMEFELVVNAWYVRKVAKDAPAQMDDMDVRPSMADTRVGTVASRPDTPDITLTGSSDSIKDPGTPETQTNDLEKTKTTTEGMSAPFNLSMTHVDLSDRHLVLDEYLHYVPTDSRPTEMENQLNAKVKRILVFSKCRICSLEEVCICVVIFVRVIATYMDKVVHSLSLRDSFSGGLKSK
jgi:hypothetical protein